MYSVELKRMILNIEEIVAGEWPLINEYARNGFANGTGIKLVAANGR